MIGNCTAAALDQVKSDQGSKATAVLVFVEMTLSAAGIYINDMFYMGNVVSISVFTIVCCNRVLYFFCFCQVFIIEAWVKH